MARKRDIVPAEPEETRAEDRRERFVLHNFHDAAAAVPDEPAERVDVEEALLHLDDPERKKTRVRRNTGL